VIIYYIYVYGLLFLWGIYKNFALLHRIGLTPHAMSVRCKYRFVRCRAPHIFKKNGVMHKCLHHFFKYIFAMQINLYLHPLRTKKETALEMIIKDLLLFPFYNRRYGLGHRLKIFTLIT